MNSTVYLRSLKFNKSSCSHCGKNFSRNEQLKQNLQQQQNTGTGDGGDDDENDPEEDVRKCYSIVFEYALKSHGITIDFNNYTHNYNHNDKAATDYYPTISNSFCSGCEATFRQLYKYYKRFIVSAGTSSFVRYIMQDSMIWAKTTVIIRNSNKTRNSHEQWTPGNDNIDDNDGNEQDDEDFDYLPPASPIVEYNDDEIGQNEDEITHTNVKNSIKNPYLENRKFSKKKLKSKAKSKSYPHHNNSSASVPFSSRNLQEAQDDNSIHHHQKENENNNDYAPATQRRVLRSSTLRKPRQSFAEHLSSPSSDDDKEWQPGTKKKKTPPATTVSRYAKVKKTALKLRRPNKNISSISTMSHSQTSPSQNLLLRQLLPVKFSKSMSHDAFLKMKRRSYHNSKIRARVRYQQQIFNPQRNHRNTNSKIFKLNPMVTFPSSTFSRPSHERNCKICHEKFSFAFLLRSHMKSVHNNEVKKYTCSFCSLTFTMKKFRKTHEEAEHGPELLKPRIPCTQDGCEKLFISIKLRNKHFSTVHSDIVENLICDTCGKSFRSRGGLRQHLRFHEFANNSPDAYKCSECPKCYKSPYALRVHIKIHHTAVKTYLCSICGISFSHSYVYKRHLRTKHADGEAKPTTTSTTGETDLPYKCEECGKGWRRKDHLTQHLRGKSHGHPWKSDRLLNNESSKRVRNRRKVQQTQDPLVLGGGGGIPIPIGYQETLQDSNASYCSSSVAADYSINTTMASGSSLQNNNAGGGTTIVKLDASNNLLTHYNTINTSSGSISIPLLANQQLQQHFLATNSSNIIAGLHSQHFLLPELPASSSSSAQLNTTNNLSSKSTNSSYQQLL